MVSASFPIGCALVSATGTLAFLLENEPKMVHSFHMLPKLKDSFYAQPGTIPPTQPVREWLKRLPRDEQFEIGGDIQDVQFGWPLGMPLVTHLRGARKHHVFTAWLYQIHP